MDSWLPNYNTGIIFTVNAFFLGSEKLVTSLVVHQKVVAILGVKIARD